MKSIAHCTLDSIVVARVGIWLLVAAGSCALVDHEVVISSISPDGRFALRTGTGDAAKSELILLPKRNADWGTIIKLKHNGEKAISHLYWTPDSKRFAFADQETQRFMATRVYEQQGDSFHVIKLPDVPLEEPVTAKDWSFREKGHSVTPSCWADSDTLLLKTWVYGYLNNRTTGESDHGDASGIVRLRFRKHGHAGPPKVIAHVKASPANTSALKQLESDPALHDFADTHC